MDPSSEVTRHAPGLLGSLIGALFNKGRWYSRVGFFIAGVCISFYAKHWVAEKMQADLELSAFFVSLFSVAIVIKVMETISSFQPKELLERVYKKLGL